MNQDTKNNVEDVKGSDLVFYYLISKTNKNRHYMNFK